MRIMKIECNITVECQNENEARAINDALALDNETYMKSKVIGSSIIAEIETEDINSLSNTINDFLSCLNVSKSSCSIIKNRK